MNKKKTTTSYLRAVFFVLALLFVSIKGEAQAWSSLDDEAILIDSLAKNEDEILTVVDEPTEFPGGMPALMQYLSSNVNYPEIAAKNNIQGRVIVSFVVERNGKPSQVTIARGVDKALDAEAIRVVKNMPAWIPGKKNGKPVRQRFNLPVVFRLQ